MKVKSLMWLIIIVLISAVAISGCIGNGEENTVLSNDANEPDNEVFENTDEDIEAVLEICIECHPKPVNTTMQSDGAHSQKNCNFCHDQHGYIPKCMNCHGPYHGNIITNCTQCHTDAHAPNIITFETETGQYSCSVCHVDEVTTFSFNPTNHSVLDCSKCHKDHGYIPQCTNCHDPHDGTMVEDDCNKCHETGHVPTTIKYSAMIPKSMCSGCHSSAISMIDNSDTKHSELLCTQCHPQHGQIPACSSCHGTPHGSTMTDCGVSCHLSGHDVWKKLG